MSQDTVLVLVAAAILIGLGVFIFRTIRAALRGEDGQRRGPLDGAGQGIDPADLTAAQRHARIRSRGDFDGSGADDGGD